MALCAVMLIIMVVASRVPFSSVMRSVKGIIVLLIFTSILNLFFHGGDTVLAVWGIFKITLEGVLYAVFLMLRLTFLVLGSAILTLTTTPVNLTDGLESLLKPLTWIKFPVHALALIMSIALRFIPTLIDETNRIISAQKARGADFESGNIFKRVKAIIPILIPLLISAFRRAEELGDAMDARCYSNTKHRTKYKKLKFTWRDGLAAIYAAIMIAGVVLFNIYAYDIFPAIYVYMVVA
jgi:energy-coupling factor transport system permease protein